MHMIVDHALEQSIELEENIVEPLGKKSIVIAYKKSKFQQYKLAPIQVCVVGLLISIQEEVNITEHVSGFRTGRICGDLRLQEGSQW
ncbi:hypothetical protein F2Q70_00040084 [Brassica cretica]|uniref:Uncharacterized protein n=1 Tax=Brassica cretica TaxID=69181 RepID=A0A8S9K1S1_BRACR|nr:hypothetical protein F2Q70_00040084 [Brassica cretica]